MLKRAVLLLICLFVAGGTAVYAADDQPKQLTAAEFESSLNFRKGDITLPGGIATLKVPDTFRYLDQKDSKRVLVDAWGNPSGAADGTLGMLFPAEVGPLDENGWGVVITYEEDGYVSDNDADSINYNDLLKDMKEGIAERNKERQKQGFRTIELAGWAAQPHYDKETHKLYWAKELVFGGDEPHTLNYNIRVLGRKGVLVLNAVAAMDQLGAVETEMQKVIAFSDFNPGYRYSDFDSKSDKTAAYGIAALVAGGVAAKAGLFGKLIGLLVAAKKVVIVGIAAIGAFLGRLFKKLKAKTSVTE